MKEYDQWVAGNPELRETIGDDAMAYFYMRSLSILDNACLMDMQSLAEQIRGAYLGKAESEISFAKSWLMDKYIHEYDISDDDELFNWIDYEKVKNTLFPADCFSYFNGKEYLIFANDWRTMKIIDMKEKEILEEKIDVSQEKLKVTFERLMVDPGTTKYEGANNE